MMALPSDYSIIGTVLALAVAILLLSGLALYVAFRVRETLCDEKGGGTRTVKVALLIGMLFLSGGVFYFFASGFNSPGGSSSTNSYSITTSVSASTTGLTSTASSTTHGKTTTTTASTTAAQDVIFPSPSCAGDRVTAGSTFECAIDIDNQGNAAYAGGTVVSDGDFSKFSFLGCTESVNGAAGGPVGTTSGSIAVGDVSPGTTVLSCSVQAPSQSGQYSNSVLTLNAVGLSQPISVTFSIQVTA